MDGMVLLLGVLFLTGAAFFAAYFLRCFALWRMGKNAGLPWAWLAWVPYGQNWLLGWLCDRARVCRGKGDLRFRLILPALSLATPSFLNIYLAERLSLPTLYDLMNRWGLYGLPSLLQTAAAVGTAFGLYHLYADYAPGKETPYAILSAVVPFAAPGILLFLLRDRIPLSAGGDPPRTPAWNAGTTGPTGPAGPFPEQPPAPPPAPIPPPPEPPGDPGPTMPPFRWKDGNKK